MQQKLIVLTYFIPVLTALALSLFFPTARHYTDPAEKKKYYILLVVTLCGAVIGGKLSLWMGDYFWPIHPLSVHELIYSGRSITGALIVGHLASACAKPLLNYKMPPNNRLAMIIPFSIAQGRVGCWLSGCCLGLPYQGFWTMSYQDNIPRFPIAQFEIIFQLSVGIFFIYCVKKNILEGRLFSLYLFLYGIFRFLSEPLRATPKIEGVISVYQILALVMIAIGGLELYWCSRQTLHKIQPL
ncbi:prolipoprotein diacylglyceryl transferase [bacterium]|nr:prolipoprotein diacylglyceryl transferase [bacterium]